MSEAEKVAIRANFVDELAGTTVGVKGIVSTVEEVLARAGAEMVYAVLVVKEKLAIARGAGSVSRDDLIDVLTGAAVAVEGFWDHTEKLTRDGAEAIANRLAAKGWGVSK